MSEFNRLNNSANFSTSFGNALHNKIATAVMIKSGMFTEAQHFHPSILIPSDIPLVKTIISLFEGAFELGYKIHKHKEAEKLLDGLPTTISEFENKFLSIILESLERDEDIANLFSNINQNNNEKYFAKLGFDCARDIWKSLKTGFYLSARGHDTEDKEIIYCMTAQIKKHIIDKVSSDFTPVIAQNDTEVDDAALLKHQYDHFYENYFTGDIREISE